MLVLGIMSGTSIDGVDYALCDVTSKSIRLVRLWSRSFPASLRSRLHFAASNDCSAHELAQLHHDLGRLYARQAAALRTRTKLVGLHGQTVFHRPDRRAPATLQIGEPAYLAEALQVPVIANFRSADLAAGGQGAPLAPLFHCMAFATRGQHVCVNNLGGISNVTSLDWRVGRKPTMAAFDTGPANVLIDLASHRLTSEPYDAGGACAARGRVEYPLVQKWLRHPYFRLPPPKSTGREVFGEPFLGRILADCKKRQLRAVDILASVTEFTARSIAMSYALHLPRLPDVIVLCGGGTKNRFLVERIRASFRNTTSASHRIVGASDLGWPTEAVEPSAFALMAFCRFSNRRAVFPTGARHSTLCGQISAP